jgi:hypothetical protein
MDRYDLSHDGNNWKLQRQGGDRASKVFDGMTKEEAVRGTSDFMQDHPGSVRIHKLDGTYEEERTYPRSADPRQSPG